MVAAVVFGARYSGGCRALCILVCFLVTKRLWALVAARRIECGGPWSDSLWLLLVTTSLL
jgi:hypothetical protein